MPDKRAGIRLLNLMLSHGNGLPGSGQSVSGEGGVVDAGPSLGY